MVLIYQGDVDILVDTAAILAPLKARADSKKGCLPVVGNAYETVFFDAMKTCLRSGLEGSEFRVTRIGEKDFSFARDIVHFLDKAARSRTTASWSIHTPTPSLSR
jgi:hypothetical protein